MVLVKACLKRTLNHEIHTCITESIVLANMIEGNKAFHALIHSQLANHQLSNCELYGCPEFENLGYIELGTLLTYNIVVAVPRSQTWSYVIHANESSRISYNRPSIHLIQLTVMNWRLLRNVQGRGSLTNGEQDCTWLYPFPPLSCKHGMYRASRSRRIQKSVGEDLVFEKRPGGKAFHSRFLWHWRVSS